MKSIKQIIKDNQKKVYELPIPKFKIGDIIFNPKYKVLTKVVNIEDTFKIYSYLEQDDKITKDARSSFIIYTLQDIIPSELRKGDLKKPRYRGINAVDTFYELINEDQIKTIKVLYGKKE